MQKLLYLFILIGSCTALSATDVAQVKNEGPASQPVIHCPCGCGCVAPCHCGCTNGQACTCHAH